MRRRRSPSALVLVIALLASLLGAVVASTPAAADPPVPTAPGAFVGLTPARVLDTRSGVGAPKGPARAGIPIHLTVAGRGGVPAGAGAVVLTITVVGTNAGGYLTAYPTGGTRPTASVVNWATGRTVAGSATVTLGTGGAIDLVAQAGKPVDVVADVTGYIVSGTPSAAGTYAARTPTRLLDTRTGNGAPRAPLAARSSLNVALAGRGGLPAGAAMSAVVATLTAVGSTTSGYLTTWGGNVPTATSSLNFAAGQTVANQVTVPVGDDGSITVYAGGGPVDVLLDVTGFVIGGTASTPGAYVPLSPPVRASNLATGPGPAAPFSVGIVGAHGLPSHDVGAVVANLTVARTSSSGYLTAWPTGAPRPVTSNLNWSTGQTVANQASITVGDSGKIDLFPSGVGPATVIVDVFGYYLPVPPPAPTSLYANASQVSVSLQWTAAPGAVGYTIRRATGTVAPATPTDGTAVNSFINHDLSLTDAPLQPGTTYSYSVFAHDSVPNYSAPATVTTATVPPDTTPPGPDTHLTAHPVGTTSLTLHWTPPSDPDYNGSIVRQAVGGTPPSTPTDGTAAGSGGLAVLVGGLAPATTYSYAVFARDTSGNVTTTPATLTVTTSGLRLGTPVTAPVAPGTRGGTPTLVLDVACAEPTACVAVGSAQQDASGLRLPTLASEAADGSWTATFVPLPADAATDATPRLDHVSCTSAAACVAIGDYVTTAGVTAGLVVTRSGADLHAHAVPASGAPDTGTSVTLGAVACPASGSCQVVGDVHRPAADATIVTATVDPSADTVVTSEAAPDPALPQATPRAVDCPTAAVCGAAGTLGGGTGALVGTWNGTTWTWSAPALPAGAVAAPGTALSDVSCPDATSCRAVGTYALDTNSNVAPLSETWNGSTWTPARIPGSTADSGTEPTTACAAAGDCVDTFYDYPNNRIAVTVAGATASRAAVVPAGRAATDLNLYDSACPAVGRCVAAGNWDAGDSRFGLLEGVFGSASVAVQVVPPGGTSATEASVHGVACASPDACVAWGDGGFGSYFLQPFAVVGSAGS